MLTKTMGIAVCLLGLASGNVLAASSPSVQIDTTIPAADGMLTTDQIPPMMLPTQTAAPAAAAQPAPAPQPTNNPPAPAH